MYLLHGLAADPPGILHASQGVLLSSANYICSYQQPHIVRCFRKFLLCQWLAGMHCWGRTSMVQQPLLLDESLLGEDHYE